ncbi:DUF551 domain-containing protein [Klebsiella pneumoniae]|nr:DUF551 domain-containing protein [Klebsiella pneumoniae]ELA2893389.1 DUF551 domain-containing protein [Klebsiella pneumoniae]
MTSKLTRGRLEKIKSWRETYGAGSNVMLPTEEAEELARIALAAMDSEPEYLPLDYLQGHKDGLEWASQLAKANHPETGDWLYDDPIELAKAIRKGPDMPPVQPVADSEPDRNPVLAYADSYRDMAKQGVESVPIWSVITDLERNIAPLYRHAQPVTVVPEEMTPEMMRSVQLNSELGAYAASNLSGAYDLFAEFWKVACRAAMLAAATQSPGSDPATVPGKWIPVSEQMPDVGVKVLCFPAKDEPIHATFNGQLWLQDVSWSGSEEPIDNVIPVTVTHWMPLPAAPQEVK